MEAAAIVLPMVAGGIGAVGTLMEGGEAYAGSKFEAKQLKRQADQELGLAGQAAAEKAREAKLANSRNLAVAAASGGSAADPTVIQIMGDVAAQGQMNALTEMYKGVNRKADLLSEANAAKWRGRNARTGSFGAAGTLLQGVASGAGNSVRMK